MTMREKKTSFFPKENIISKKKKRTVDMTVRKDKEKVNYQQREEDVDYRTFVTDLKCYNLVENTTKKKSPCRGFSSSFLYV